MYDAGRILVMKDGDIIGRLWDLKSLYLPRWQVQTFLYNKILYLCKKYIFGGRCLTCVSAIWRNADFLQFAIFCFVPDSNIAETIACDIGITVFGISAVLVEAIGS